MDSTLRNSWRPLTELLIETLDKIMVEAERNPQTSQLRPDELKINVEASFRGSQIKLTLSPGIKFTYADDPPLPAPEAPVGTPEKKEEPPPLAKAPAKKVKRKGPQT